MKSLFTLLKKIIPNVKGTPDLRLITLHWVEGLSETSYIISGDQVDTFVKACVSLHHEPGINPHNGGNTSRISKITAQTLHKIGPFWWSTPNLQNNNDPKGAMIFSWQEQETLWEVPSADSK